MEELKNGAYKLDSGEVVDINENAVVLHDCEDHYIQSYQIFGLTEDDFLSIFRKELREKIEQRKREKKLSQTTQDMYLIPMTVEKRKAQKKMGQALHKELNKIGIRVQLKGENNDFNEMVLALPNKKFILINMENEMDFFIGDRWGCSRELYFETKEQLMEYLKEEFLG